MKDFSISIEYDLGWLYIINDLLFIKKWKAMRYYQAQQKTLKNGLISSMIESKIDTSHIVYLVGFIEQEFHCKSI